MKKYSKVKLILDKKLLNNKDFDFFHYEQCYPLAKCKEGIFYIMSCGELKCDYFDNNGNWVDNAIDTIQNWYVRNNEEYIKAVDNGNLVLDMNNWFEIQFIDNNGKYVEEENQYLWGEIFGSITDCYNFMKDKIKKGEVI